MTRLITSVTATFYGEDYVQSAAGDAETGDLLFPTDSISCGDARWTKSEMTTPYFMSPPLGNDDIDLLSDLGHGSPFENDPIIPFTDQSKFSLPSSQRSQDSLTLAFGNTHNPAALQSFGTSIEGWSFRGQAFGDRFYQTSIETNPLPGLFQPAEEPTITTPKVLDLGYSYIESAVGQHLEQEKSDLIVKIANGYNIQTISEQSVAGGIEALRQGLAASGQSRGERSGLSAQEIQRLLVRGKPGDPSTSKGHIIEPLTEQHLQMALTRYGQQRNMYYRLGVVRSTRSSFHFQLSMLPNSPPKESQIIIWVYQEPIDYDMSTGQYNYSRWAAITSSNVPGKTASYAQVLQSATPKIRELEKPVNPQLLHDGRRRSVSAPQSELLPATTASAIATKCCGKLWPTKTALKTHEKTHGRPDDRPIRCEICDRGFLWQKDLTRHMPKHNGKKDFICPVDWCDRSYTRRDNMVRHHDDAHPEMSPLSTKSMSTKSRASSSSESYRRHPRGR